MKHVVKLDDESREKKMCIVPENELEERFFLWFGFQYGITCKRVNNRDSLLFPSGNDPEQTIDNLKHALETYKARFHYREIPDVSGLPLQDAGDIIDAQGIKWAVEAEIYTRAYPPGHVVFQNPRSGAVGRPHSVVYLKVSKGYVE
ncbi:MAG: PASTA domain-containing protein [Candidatus Eremiobacteraeota bacterium]|nr:PASTA domain-containing protein [Candidatus Eremiobacteraeota bacterium]